LLTGALYYNTTTQTMKVYDGANWITATAAGTTALLTYKYVATAGQTTFSGAASVGGTLSYTSNNIIVFVNGVSLDSTDYTATNGTSVVLASGAALNDEVVIVAFKSFTVADTYTKGEVDAFAVKLTGAQTVAGVKTFSSQPVMSAGVSLGSNGQIVFPASQNASSDANTLDDYEEGSWTPTISFNGGTTGMTFVSKVGSYTRVGRLVYCTLWIQFTSKGSSTGTALVTGLPFLPINVAGTYNAAPITHWFGISGVSAIGGYIPGNETTVYLTGGNPPSNNSTALTDGNFSNTSYFLTSFCYQAA
jgi:hypothetical protein